MWTELDKEIVREQRAGYDLLDRFNLEESKRATFAEKLRDLDVIMQFAQKYCPPFRDDSDSVRQRWRMIRERYSASHKPTD